METFSKTTRFILTCNYVEKIIDPIQSRCQTFAITPPNKTDVAKRLVSVLEEKGIEYDIKDVADAVKRYGRLYALTTILHYRVSNEIKIQLLKKKLENLTDE